MAEQYDDPEYALESLSAEDLANLLVEPDYSAEESSEVEEAPPDAEEAFLAALADLEDDIYRTGRRVSTTDVERTAARHGLSAREAARLELRAEDEGLVDAVEPRSDNPAALVETRSLGSLDGWFQAASRFPLLTAEQETALARSYEAGRRATEELAEGSVVDDDLRRKLTDSAARGQHARLVLICSNLRLVAAMTRAYHSEGLERVDLMQEGVVGLMRAVEKFDWRLGYKFSTYATHWIRQATQRGIDMQGRLIRLPVHMLDRLRGAKREARRMGIRLGREPTIFELGETVGIDPAELAFLRDLEDVVSLDQPVGRDVDATVLGELLASEDGVEDVVERIFRSEQISRWLDCLTERERMVIERRFGLRDDHVETLEEIGRDLGVTRERIRQIEAKALEKLEATAGPEQ